MTLKPLIALFLFAALAAGSMPALAHPEHEGDHSHGHKHRPPAPIDEAAAKERAVQEVGQLVAKKKVEPSWTDSTVKSVEKKTLKKGWEWLVTLENSVASKDKLLYVFLKPHGKFVAANFTGK
jgi:hypothetical protein